MALAPKFAGQKLASSSIQPKAVHTLELCTSRPPLPFPRPRLTSTFPDLDYVCPFSAKMFKTIYTSPLRDTLLNKYGSSLVTIFRQQIQPWHPSSTLAHEAGFAVLQLAPNKFYDFSEKLFAKQTDFFDANVVNETRNDTYKRLAGIAGSVGVDEKKVLELLWISDKPAADGGLNTGNGVTADVRVQVKANRMVGVHVSPTVVFDGVVVGEISSGWSGEQWEEWLGKNVK
jgi:predicted DsbA family dithiol-disulfide isomerase